MPKTEGDPLGPEFARRLRGELDRIEPRFSSPRYLGASRRRVTWRLAPAVLAMSLVAILGLSAYAATGSPNPVVWTEDVVTVIHPQVTSPAQSPTPQQHRGSPATTPSGQDRPHSSPEPTERAEPTDQPEPTQRPEPAETPEPADTQTSGGSGDRSSGGSSGGQEASPSPGTD